MRLIGKNKIQSILQTDDSASKWMRAWVAELVNANWKHPEDVCKQFPNIHLYEDGHFAFPIQSCSKEVYIKIAFHQNIAIITGIQ